MINKIHIFGASGSGTSTLGRELASVLSRKWYDSDDYFWLEKYTKIREIDVRVSLLKKDLDNNSQWILSGALCGWGDIFMDYFDLVIFLYTPEKTRMDRLYNRELQRYGDSILPGGSMYEESKAFLNWAAQYDKGGLEIRSKVLHEEWMSGLSCPVLRIEGEQNVKERVDIVLNYLHNNIH